MLALAARICVRKIYSDSSLYCFIHQLCYVTDHQPNLCLESHSISFHRFYATLNIKLKKKIVPLLLAAMVHKCSLHLQANDMCPAHYCCSQQFPSSPWLLLITHRCIFPALVADFSMVSITLRGQSRSKLTPLLDFPIQRRGQIDKSTVSPDCSWLESQFALAESRSDCDQPHWRAEKCISF